MRYEADTSMTAPRVLKKALKHFGETDAGLKVTASGGDSICMEGTDGFVSISACRSNAKGKKTHLEIETREYDNQVTAFLRSL